MAPLHQVVTAGTREQFQALATRLGSVHTVITEYDPGQNITSGIMATFQQPRLQEEVLWTRRVPQANPAPGSPVHLYDEGPLYAPEEDFLAPGQEEDEDLLDLTDSDDDGFWERMEGVFEMDDDMDVPLQVQGVRIPGLLRARLDDPRPDEPPRRVADVGNPPHGGTEWGF